MSRELSDVILVSLAVLIPTMAIVTAYIFNKLLAHRRWRNDVATENRQLRAELVAVTGRVSEIERVVTDKGQRLAQEIDTLRVTTNEKDRNHPCVN